MKIAFLFAGQFRPIPKDLVRCSIQNLTKGIDYDIFCYSWDELGESLDHRDKIPIIKSDNNSYDHISHLFSEFNPSISSCVSHTCSDTIDGQQCTT